MCVHNHSYACVYTRGLSTPTISPCSENIFCAPNGINKQWEVIAPNGVRTSGLWISSPTLCQLSHPVTPIDWPAPCSPETVEHMLATFPRHLLAGQWRSGPGLDCLSHWMN